MADYKELLSQISGFESTHTPDAILQGIEANGKDIFPDVVSQIRGFRKQNMAPENILAGLKKGLMEETAPAGAKDYLELPGRMGKAAMKGFAEAGGTLAKTAKVLGVPGAEKAVEVTDESAKFWEPSKPSKVPLVSKYIEPGVTSTVQSASIGALGAGVGAGLAPVAGVAPRVAGVAGYIAGKAPLFGVAQYHDFMAQVEKEAKAKGATPEEMKYLKEQALPYGVFSGFSEMTGEALTDVMAAKYMGLFGSGLKEEVKKGAWNVLKEYLKKTGKVLPWEIFGEESTTLAQYWAAKQVSLSQPTLGEQMDVTAGTVVVQTGLQMIPGVAISRAGRRRGWGKELPVAPAPKQDITEDMKGLGGEEGSAGPDPPPPGSAAPPGPGKSPGAGPAPGAEPPPPGTEPPVAPTPEGIQGQINALQAKRDDLKARGMVVPKSFGTQIKDLSARLKAMQEEAKVSPPVAPAPGLASEAPGRQPGSPLPEPEPTTMKTLTPSPGVKPKDEKTAKLKATLDEATTAREADPLYQEMRNLALQRDQLSMKFTNNIIPAGSPEETHYADLQKRQDEVSQKLDHSPAHQAWVKALWEYQDHVTPESKKKAMGVTPTPKPAEPEKPKPLDAIKKQIKNGELNLFRVEEKGRETFSHDKPQGLYMSIEYPGFKSPHADLGGPENRIKFKPKNPLVIEQENFVGNTDAGVAALRELVGEKEFNRLTRLGEVPIKEGKLENVLNRGSRGTSDGRKALIEEAKKEYPRISWNKYFDAYEVLMALGAQKAREAGHDIIISLDKYAPEFSEAVLLNPSGEKAETKPPVPKVPPPEKPTEKGQPPVARGALPAPAPKKEKKKSLKPSRDEFAQKLIDADLMREADRGKKQYAYNFRDAIPIGRWLTRNQIRDRVYNLGQEGAGYLSDKLGPWVKIGLLDQRFMKDGTPVYAWKGTETSADTFTEEEIEKIHAAPKAEEKAKAKEPWEMKAQEYSDHEAKIMGEIPKPISEQFIGWHKGKVRDALKAGKSVPPEVLKDYPDLAKKEEKPKAPAPAPEEKPKPKEENKEAAPKEEAWEPPTGAYEANLGMVKALEHNTGRKYPNVPTKEQFTKKWKEMVVPGSGSTASNVMSVLYDELNRPEEAKPEEKKAKTATFKKPARRAEPAPKPKKEPGTLLAWLKKKGGVWDESLKGEMQALHSNDSGVVGLVNKKGQTFDELASHAVDDGWLPKGSGARDLLDLLNKDIAASKQGKPRATQAGKEKAPEEPEHKLTPEEEKQHKEFVKLEKEGFNFVSEPVLVGDLKPGDELIIKGEKYKHEGFDKEGNAIIKDGETFRLDAFEQIDADAVKEIESGKRGLNPVEIKALGLSEAQVKILDKMRTEDPENYRKLLASYGEAAKSRAEELRKGKKEKMTQEGMFGEKPRQGGMKFEVYEAPPPGQEKQKEERKPPPPPPTKEQVRGEMTPFGLELPELVELAKTLTGSFPKIIKAIQTTLGTARGLFNPRTGRISINRDIFGDIKGAARTLGHEIGHLADWIPDHTLGRGNILGRIASLKNYTKSMLEGFPESPYSILTDADKKALRKEAERQLREQVKKEGAKELSSDDILKVWNDVENANPKLKIYIATLSKAQKIEIAKSAMKGVIPEWVTFSYSEKTGAPEDVKDLFRKMLEEEIARRALIEKKTIMQELKALTMWWKPFNPAFNEAVTKMRHSPEELYADALSVLLNAPESLIDQAPTFYKAFFAYMGQKPDFKAAYRGLQDLMAGGRGEVLQHREENIAAGRKQWEEEKKKAHEPGEWEATPGEKILNEFVDKASSVYKYIKSSKVRYALEKFYYNLAKTEAYLRSVSAEATKPAENKGVNLQDIEHFYFLNRIINERTKIANPFGIDPENAKELMENMRKRIGDKGLQAIRDAFEAHWGIRNQTVIPELRQTMPFNEATQKKIEDNKHYATFDIVGFATGAFGGTPTARIFQQFGTLSPAGPAFTTTVLKDIALLRLISYTNAAKAIVEGLKEEAPNFVKEIEVRGPFIPRQVGKGEGIITYQDHGKTRAFLVPKAISEALERSPVESWVITRFMGALSKPFRALFVNYNPGFWAFNMKRDFESALRTLPQATVMGLGKHWMQAWKPTFQEIFNKKIDPTIQKMLDNGELIPSVDFTGAIDTDLEFERQLIKFDILKHGPKNKLFGPLHRVADWMNMVASMTERVTKVAAHNYLQENFPNLTMDEIAHQVRRAGSPPFLVKGKAMPIINNIILFANPAIQGTRMHIDAIGQNPKEYAWKTVKYTLIPKMMMYGAAIGLMGADWKYIFDGISEYNKTNYSIVPLGKTEGGKSIYLRFPVDEQSRLIGGVFWKLMNLLGGDSKNWMQVFSYAGQQAPNWNPAGTILDNIYDFYIAGKNPYDSYRGGPVVPEQQFAAKDVSIKPHKTFWQYIWNQSGLGIIHRFKSEEIESAKSELEKIIGVPLVSNVLGRFLAVSDAGVPEKIRETLKPIKGELAKVSLDAKEGVRKLLEQKGEKLTTDELLAIQAKPELVEKDMLRKLTKVGGSRAMRYVEQYLAAPTKVEKAAVLNMLSEEIRKGAMGPMGIKPKTKSAEANQ
jgi:hypothetical protein